MNNSPILENIQEEDFYRRIEMTPTPRTDAQLLTESGNDTLIRTDFARQLERELQEVKIERDKFKLHALLTRDEVNKERDQWRECSKQFAKAFIFPTLSMSNANAIAYRLRIGQNNGGLTPEALANWIKSTEAGLLNYSACVLRFVELSKSK